MMLTGLIRPTFTVSVPRRSVGVLPILCILGLYAISWIGSDIALCYRNASFYKLAPYRLSAALEYIHSSKRLTDQDVHFILLFHPWNAKIALAMAQRTQTEAVWQKWMQRAMREHPSDTSIPATYIETLATAAPAPDSCTGIRLITESPDLPCMDYIFLPLFKTREYLAIIPLLNGPFGQSKFLYALGRLELKNYDAIPAIIALWTRARDLAPQWGYFHIEVASLIAYYHNQNQQEAAPTLRACLSNKDARALCQKYLSDPSHLTDPGFWNREILEIPFTPNTP